MPAPLKALSCVKRTTRSPFLQRVRSLAVFPVASTTHGAPHRGGDEVDDSVLEVEAASGARSILRPAGLHSHESPASLLLEALLALLLQPGSFTLAVRMVLEQAGERLLHDRHGGVGRVGVHGV